MQLLVRGWLNSVRFWAGLVCDGFPSCGRQPGWDAHSWGYHGDDGHLFVGGSGGMPFGPRFGEGGASCIPYYLCFSSYAGTSSANFAPAARAADVVGCGVCYCQAGYASRRRAAPRACPRILGQARVPTNNSSHPWQFLHRARRAALFYTKNGELVAPPLLIKLAHTAAAAPLFPCVGEEYTRTHTYTHTTYIYSRSRRSALQLRRRLPPRQLRAQ
eukprot:SAG11_NODE_2052_length_3879_cov_2.030159_3_plen_216_part_00